MSSDSRDQLYAHLIKRYPERLIATPDKDLVIEGFPRSANTFIVEFMELSARSRGRQLSIAHHTHDPKNIELGIANGIPCLVLVRDPLEAITSYCIYHGLSIEESASRYEMFYENLTSLAEPLPIVDFELILSNPSTVMGIINRSYSVELPIPEDDESISKLAVAEIKQRSIKTHGHENYARKSGAPSSDRTALKNEVRPLVKEFLDSHPLPVTLYRQISHSGSFWPGTNAGN
jgi:hypothetical protein